MPSDVIVASIILTIGLSAGVGGSIIYATRNRTIDMTGTAYLGRNEDRIVKSLKRIEENQKRQN